MIFIGGIETSKKIYEFRLNQSYSPKIEMAAGMYLQKIISRILDHRCDMRPSEFLPNNNKIKLNNL